MLAQVIENVMSQSQRADLLLDDGIRHNLRIDDNLLCFSQFRLVIRKQRSRCPRRMHD